MPSFEHTNQDSSKAKEDSLYQPGKNRDQDTEDAEAVPEELLPTSQSVTRQGDVAAEAEMVAAEEAAKEAAREEIANRPPRYIDEAYGDPAPTIQQSIRIKPQPAGPRKRGLNRRGKQAAKVDPVKGGGSFGEVESPTLAHESLSGHRVKGGKVEAPPERPRRNQQKKPATMEQSGEGPERKNNAGTQTQAQDAPKRDRPPRKRNNNRQRKPKSQESRTAHKAFPREQTVAQKPVAEPEPTGFFGKIKKAIGGIFSNSSEPEGRKADPGKQYQQGNNDTGKGARPGNNRGAKGSGQRQQNPHSQNQGDGPNKPRRSRGGRRRGGHNRNRSNQGQNGSNSTQSQSGDAS